MLPKDTSLDTTLSENHLGLVKSIANGFATRLPAYVLMDDLIDAGVEGLINAAERYLPEKQVAFSTYASVRIRGSILDFLRHQDWPPRSVRRKIRRLEQAGAVLEQKLGRTPGDEDLAEFLEVSLENLREDQVHAASSTMVSLQGLYIHGPKVAEEVPFEPKAPDDIQTQVEREEMRAFLCKSLEELPRRD